MAIPGPTNAAGLGKLVVLSALGEPLHAEIDLLLVGEMAGLTPRLAPPEAYRIADYRYSPVLAGLRLAVKQEANGRHYLEIRSTQSVFEPYVQLLIELDWNAARIVRGYTVLIDPHGYGVPVAQLVEWLPTAVRPAVRVQATAPVVGNRNPPVRPVVRDPLTALAPTAKGKVDRVARATLDDQAKINAKTLAGLLARVDALELSMQSLQRQLELLRQAAPASSPKPAAAGQKLPIPAVAPAAQPVVPPQPVAQAPTVVVQPPAVTAQPPTAVTQPPAAVVQPPIGVAQPPAKSPVVDAPAAVLVRSDTLINVALLVLAGGSLIMLFAVIYWMTRRQQGTDVTTEDMLEKLLARNPQRDDVQLKLLEIYAARGDRKAYQNMAGRYYILSGGHGDDWLKVASRGSELDPGNPLYDAGKYLASVDSASDSANAVRH